MNKIAITTTSFAKDDDEPMRLLDKSGFKIMMNPHGRKLQKDEIISLCDGALGIIAGTEKLDAETLSRLKGLRVISRCGVGMDNIDMGEAKKLGIKVLNTPDAPTVAVAELAVGLLLDLFRSIGRMDRSIRGGKWEKLTGYLCFGKKVGIIGFGRIGKKVAELLGYLGCEIRYVDPMAENAPSGAEQATLSSLLPWADAISIHVSTSDRIIGAKEIASMKDGAFILNLSRGGVVDEEELYKALKSGHIAGAALDVFENEPYSGPLKDMDNVILTPHIGSYALESRIEMEVQAAKNLLEALSDKESDI